MCDKYESEIDLKDVWLEVFKYKWWIVMSGFFFGVFAIFIALRLPNIYQSNIVLVPNSDEQGGLSSLAKNLGGLASLTGIGLGKSSGPDKAQVALEVMKSQEFLVSFIKKYDLQVPLIATIGIKYPSYDLLFDEELYDAKSNQWIRETVPPKAKEPSDEEIFEAFMEIFSAEQDIKTGFVRGTIEFYSPQLAKKWLELVFFEINELIKDKDKIEAEKSIVYLTEVLAKTHNSNMKATFYQLIEEQTKILMLAESRDEYVLKTISSPVVPEKKMKPRRALIVIAGVIMGGVISVLLILFRYFLSKN